MVMLRRKSGFTIIEVIVVIAIIGILTTIGIIAFNKYRTDARDSQRKAQITVISQALEKYFNANGEYPGCTSMTASPSTISSNTLVGIDTSVFVAPGSSLTNSITCGTPSTPDYFGYIGTGASCASGSACESYTLQYKSETSGSLYSIYASSAAGLVTDKLVLNLDAGNTTSYPGSGTSWFDISGSNKTSTLMNGVGYSSANNGALVFDGVDDYVLTPAIDNLGLNSVSMSMGVWVSASTSAGNIISMSGQNPQAGWNMPPISATATTFSGKMWGGNRLYSSTYTIGSWYYLNLVWNANTSTQSFYMNGTLQGSQSGFTYVGSGLSNYLFIGQSNPGADNTGMLQGKIAAVQVYANKALSQAEITQNFNYMKSRYGL